MPRIIESQNSNLVGKNIKTIRQRQKVSQKQLSGKLELHAVYICRGSISRVESGERTVTDIEIDGFCKVLNITLNELFYGEK